MPHSPTKVAVLALLADLAAGPGIEVVLPADTHNVIGITDRGLRLALAHLEKAGAITWRRRRPGRPAKPDYYITTAA